MSKQRTYNQYRQMFPVFHYDSYHYETREDGFHLAFRFSLSDKLVFEPTAFFPARPFLHFDQPKELLDTLVFHIGMIELISYWKACCPPTVRIHCPHPPIDEAFWKKLYWHGLGEFFYVNDIKADYDSFLNFEPSESTEFAELTELAENSERYLVPIGGGKDSVVTLEALRQAGCPVRPLIMNPRGATTLCAERGGFPLEEVLVVKRSIHPLLLELNKKGCLNGHTPFSAMLAFYTLLASAFSGIRNIALSNENSANESTVVGTTVNHQYSKSLEFENDFRRYTSQVMGLKSRYFSFLRPLSELQIAELFAKEPKYFDVFKSCNRGSKEDIWCGACPKCLFAYIILSPFIAPATLNGIFGKDMLADPEMEPYLKQLTGEAATKPFECVGTISEVRQALAMRQDHTLQPSHTLFPDHNLTPTELAILKNRFHA